MYNNPAILKAYGEAGLIPGVKELMTQVDDVGFAQALQLACGHFVAAFERPFSERIVDFVERAIIQARR
jgi:hypothetical protein